MLDKNNLTRINYANGFGIWNYQTKDTLKDFHKYSRELINNLNAGDYLYVQSYHPDRITSIEWSGYYQKVRKDVFISLYEFDFKETK